MKNKFNINDKVYFIETDNIRKCPSCNGEYRASINNMKRIFCKTCNNKGVIVDDNVNFEISSYTRLITEICLWNNRITYKLLGLEDDDFSEDTIGFTKEELIEKLEEINKTWSFH